MPTRSNEQLCRLAQKGDTAARDILLEKNLGFIRKIALEQYRNMGLDENDIGIDLDDLMQEGSIGLLNAIPLFDAGRGMKFLTYAAPALRNAMTDCIRAALGLFEQRMADKKDGPGFQRVYLDDVLSEDERMLRIEAIADPHTQTPEQIYIQKEQLIELYAALDKLTAREQTYLLYRYGFTDGIEHPLIGAALHFHRDGQRLSLMLNNHFCTPLPQEIPMYSTAVHCFSTDLSTVSTFLGRLTAC
jgi:RNA polymerase primary sigma factor/RNA polymerase sporulation-specific sigma factor